MISTDLIVVTPWIVFGAALVAVCVQLLRSRRAGRSRRAERPTRRPAQTQEEQCPQKKQTAPKR